MENKQIIALIPPGALIIALAILIGINAFAQDGPILSPPPQRVEAFIIEQRFESGWMFWQHFTDQIFVLSTDTDGQARWTRHLNTFAPGEPEINPALTPPNGLLQPERIFGKLWRENPEIQNRLGWATEPERSFTALYEYHTNGIITRDNRYIDHSGFHILPAATGATILLNDDDQSWQFIDAPPPPLTTAEPFAPDDDAIPAPLATEDLRPEIISTVVIPAPAVTEAAAPPPVVTQAIVPPPAATEEIQDNSGRGRGRGRGGDDNDDDNGDNDDDDSGRGRGRGRGGDDNDDD